LDLRGEAFVGQDLLLRCDHIQVGDQSSRVTGIAKVK